MPKSKNCNKIKDMEDRLVCIKTKYDHLTKELENSRSTSTSDSGMLDYQQLIEERRIVEQYMNRLLKRIDIAEKSSPRSRKASKVSLGSTVALINDESKLRFRLVEEIHSQEDNQISSNSPIGKAIIGKRVGEEVQVETPNGKIHYTIKSVE